jgi:hypothetical protein
MKDTIESVPPEDFFAYILPSWVLNANSPSSRPEVVGTLPGTALLFNLIVDICPHT